MGRLTVTSEGAINAVMLGTAGALFGLGGVAYNEATGVPLVPQAEAQLQDATVEMQHAEGGLAEADASIEVFGQKIGSVCLDELARHEGYRVAGAILDETASEIAGKPDEPCGSNESAVREILVDDARLQREAGLARSGVKLAERDLDDAHVALQDAHRQATDADGDGVGQEDLTVPALKWAACGAIAGVLMPFEVRLTRRRNARAYQG